ncbi:MAG TPA: bifunctional 5,10-methylenetetrahydrofolate dehydrogenase/5,10-methenyltetrahydrofolate cyclohydrolase [Thermoanaerobaculia bacterium]|mgnify:CR=1 FL=1|nr:bifunctional 5,10-methylenetetrahydrofolate dehydrogenase/5,10-methenyltetrahydrofolate cyclohydrolase [Thermoanaerobaculia bacterium]
MAEILDGARIAAEIRAEVAARTAERTAAGHRPPGLAVILAGDDPASHVYVGSKVKASAEAGFVSRQITLPSTATAEEVAAAIDSLNQDPAIDGFLVQLPLPEGLPSRELLASVDPDKDVDGFHAENVGRLWLGEETLAPATPSGIIEMLRRSGVPMRGAEAVVVGRSNIVGKPMAALLLAENATVTVCHSRTRDLAEVCRRADILVAAMGRPGTIGPEHVKPGATVVDVGTNRVEDPALVEHLFPGDEKRRAALEKRGYTLVGDVDFTRVAPIAGKITPVPGGVGPLTVAMLLANTLKAAIRRAGA